MTKKSLPLSEDGSLLISSHPGTLVIEHQRVEISDTFRGPITLLSGMLIVNGTVDGDIDVDGGRLIVLGTVTGRVTNGSGSVEVSGQVGDLRGPPAYTRVLPGSRVGAHTVGADPGAVDTWAELLTRAADPSTSVQPDADPVAADPGTADPGTRAPIEPLYTAATEPPGRIRDVVEAESVTDTELAAAESERAAQARRQAAEAKRQAAAAAKAREERRAREAIMADVRAAEATPRVLESEPTAEPTPGGYTFANLPMLRLLGPRAKVNDGRENLPSVGDTDQDLLNRVNRARRRQMQLRLSAGAAVAVVALAGILLATGGDSPPPQEPTPVAVEPIDAAPADPVETGALARTLLANLVVEEQTTLAPLVGDWDLLDEDRNGNCQSVRTEALRATSLEAVATNQGCGASAGQWIDQLTGETIDNVTAVDVELLISPLDTHRAGGWAWSVGRREAYASDLGDPAVFFYQAAGTTVDRTGGPDAFRPTSETLWCWYATDWVRVKWRWSLSVTNAEQIALLEMLDTCAAADTVSLPGDRAFPPVRVR
ncbi:MAG: hypothetical protein HKN26_14000 [Acidimicrobiales bacterium]|nr:hypothetical protein [Acidimicrobiales bacterium]